MKDERQSLYEMVSEAIEESYNIKPAWMKDSPANMKASFLGTPCLRKIYYNYLRVEADYGWKWENIENFELGEAIHTMIQRWLFQMGVYIPFRDKKGGKIKKHWKVEWEMKPPDPEFPVNDSDISVKNNKIDGILKLDGEFWLLEVKSINEKGWNKYIKKDAKQEHKEQGNFYLHLFEQNYSEGLFDHIPELENFKELAGVIFVYTHREADNIPWKEFWVERDPELFEATIGKILAVKEHVEEGTLPAKTEDFCPWCNYRDKCKRDFRPKT